VIAVIAGILVGYLSRDPWSGLGDRLQWAGTLALTAAPFLALVAVGLSAWHRRRSLAWYGFGALAVAVIGAVLAR